MHTGPVPGDFTAPEASTDLTCRKCKRAGHVTVQTWESSDGAYEDERYTCRACGHWWWVEGNDA